MLGKSWIVGLFVLAAVIGAIFGGTYVFAQSSYAAGMERGGRPGFNQAADAPATNAPAGDAAAQAPPQGFERDGSGRDGRPNGRDGEHGHTNFSFGRGIVGFFMSLVKAGLLIAAVVVLGPRLSGWFSRGPAAKEKAADAEAADVPPSKEEPPAPDEVV